MTTVAPFLVNCTLGSVVMSFGVPGGEPANNYDDIIYAQIRIIACVKLLIGSVPYSLIICKVMVSLSAALHSTVSPFKAVFAGNVNTEDVIALPLPVAMT